MVNLLVKALINYIEKHPDVIEQLVEQLVMKLIDELKKKA